MNSQFDEKTEDAFKREFCCDDTAKKVKIGDVFKHPDLGMVRYVRPDRKYSLTCELVLVNGSDNWPRYPSWNELYKMGFDLEI